MAKKGGGSQLSQLKSRLHNDGITDRRQMKASAKKRKRGQAGAEKDELAERRDKLSKIASSSAFNPFEERVTRPKNVVLGRRITGAVGRPGLAKLGGLKERNERLLPEWQSRNKSGSFVDRRFGENGSDLTLEEKMLERFTKERQNRVGKTSLYNLDDAEEEGLTHYGKSLNDLDDYDDIHLSDEEAGLDVEGAHFGGFEEDKQEEEEEDEERKKSKAEVMREVMAKSKLAKYERQQTRAADDEIRNNLDDELGDIRSLLFEQTKPVDAAPFSADKRPLIGDGKRKDAYDSAVRELAFERRAKPQDRLKSEAEKAEELAKKLKKAEIDRLKRMRGEEVSDDEGSRKDKRGGVGGDDLDDDFELDGVTSRDVYGLGQGLNSGVVDEEEEEDDEDDDDDDEDDGDEDVEEGDDFEDMADVAGFGQTGEDVELEDDEDNDNDQEEYLTAKSTRQGRKSNQKKQSARILPFEYPFPSTHDDLMEIIDSNEVSYDQVPVVLKRIRIQYHPSLAENNKFKLQAFLGVLLDHIVYITTQFTLEDNSTSIKLIDAIIPHIFSLSKTYPIASSEHFVTKLAMMQRNLTRGLSKGPLLLDSKTWPGLTECVLLKLTGTIWSTSDRSHAVATPLFILIGQYLSSCRIRTISDLVKGLFLACLAYNNESQSRRLVPEALNFLHNAITILAPVKSMKALRQVNQAYGIPWPDVGLEETKAIHLIGSMSAPKERIDFMKLLLSGEEEEEEESKATVLLACFNLLSDFASLYAGSTAFTETFSPFHSILGNLATLHPTLEEKRSVVAANLSRLLTIAKSERRALRLQAHRAIAIASHIPKFDQGFNPERRGGRTFDPDTERAEQAKLKSLLKKERKGAIRELRRDNEFLANEKRKERETEEQRYKKNIDKIVGSLSTERGEQKKYIKEKDRLKRRSGKK
ncbi:hypothetical protein CBS101457_000880 [Exobasidium rhododendri]|nr:hypothetical protein CBS101457_000880 [Exobasidium rhododendri]